MITLSQREWFRLWRRRLGWDQRQAATFMGVSLNRYQEWEREEREYTGARVISLGEFTVGEQCWIMRERSGMGLAEVCKRMKLSKPTYLLRERVGTSDVFNFWRRHGLTVS